MEKDFLIAGGDRRMQAAETMFRQSGCSVGRWFEEGDASPIYQDYSCIVLPVPAVPDGIHLNCVFKEKPFISDILACMHSGQTLMGGMLPESVTMLAKQKGVRAVDYAKDELFQQQNAYLTAEGAISLAVAKIPFALWHSKCLVVGFGRIGKLLADYLKAMGATVSVAARHKDSLLLAKISGYESVAMTQVSDSLRQSDVVFNTVPEKILDLTVLSNNAYYMELASKPYGDGFETNCVRGLTRLKRGVILYTIVSKNKIV